MAHLHTGTLINKDWAPENMVKVAALFYGHGVPLGIASRTYNICNKGTLHCMLWEHSILLGLQIQKLFIWHSILMFEKEIIYRSMAKVTRSLKLFNPVYLGTILIAEQ